MSLRSSLSLRPPPIQQSVITNNLLLVASLLAPLLAHPSQLETSHSTLTNLELQSTFGQSAWLTHNKALSKQAGEAKERLEQARLQVDEINNARQQGQEGIRGKANRLTRKWQELVTKNMELENVNENIKRQKT